MIRYQHIGGRHCCGSIRGSFSPNFLFFYSKSSLLVTSWECFLGFCTFTSGFGYDYIVGWFQCLLQVCCRSLVADHSCQYWAISHCSACSTIDEGPPFGSCLCLDSRRLVLSCWSSAFSRGLMVDGCWLFGCRSSATFCWLLVVGCWLLAVVRWLLVV